MKIIAIYSIKGGVGKTSTTVNLAYLASQDYKVLVWDLDPQGAMTFYFNKKVKCKNNIDKVEKQGLNKFIKKTSIDNLDIIPADLYYKDIDIKLNEKDKPVEFLKKLIDEAKLNNYDFLFLDCPPTRSLVAENILNCSDLILVPTIPTILSIRTYNQLISYCDTVNIIDGKVLTFLSMMDNRKSIHKRLAKEIRNSLPKSQILDVQIPNSTYIEQMGLYSKSVIEFAPKSNASFAYKNLWKEVKTQPQIKG